MNGNKERNNPKQEIKHPTTVAQRTKNSEILICPSYTILIITLSTYLLLMGIYHLKFCSTSWKLFFKGIYTSFVKPPERTDHRHYRMSEHLFLSEKKCICMCKMYNAEESLQ